MRSSRWLIFAPVAILALFAPQANAESIAGLEAVGYSITEIPPVKSDEIYQQCGVDVVPFINVTFDYEQNLFGDCGWDSFMIHYTGSITIPEHDTIAFWLANDDGGTVKIGSNEFGVWSDQGCSISYESVVEIEAGEYPIDAWFYENGGSTCFMLAWNIDDAGWTIVPPSAFSTSNQPVDTTVPDTSIPSDTSIPESTTTWASTTTFTTSTTTTSTIAPSTTAPVISVSTTTTVQIILPEPTMPEPSTTEPTTTLPAEIIDTSLPASEALLDNSTSTTSSPTETLPIVEMPSEPSTSLPNALQSEDTIPPTTTEITLPEGLQVPQPISDEVFTEILKDLEEASSEEVEAIVETLLQSNLNSEQAVTLVSNVEVLAVLTEDQAIQVFSEIEPEQLSEESAALIADALNSPEISTTVKEAFEQTINIFGNDGFAKYVPVDSTVTVAVRRTIIVGTTILVAMPSPAVRRKQ